MPEVVKLYNMSLIRMFAKAKQAETQNESIEIIEREDESINAQPNITELPTQTDSGNFLFIKTNFLIQLI